jgi:hypothetical protein
VEEGIGGGDAGATGHGWRVAAGAETVKKNGRIPFLDATGAHPAIARKELLPL